MVQLTPTLMQWLALLMLAVAAAQPLQYNGSVIPDPNGDGTVLAYLPPPAVTNHAASIEQLPGGTLLLAWFTGLKEEAAGCAIAVSRLVSGTLQWTLPIVVSERAGYSNQNPVLFFDAATNTTHLYHSQLKANAGEGLDNLWHLTSVDGGLSWSNPEPFFAIKNGGVFDRNRIIVRSDGSLLFPLYYTTSGPPNSPFVLISSASNHSQWGDPVNVPGAANRVQPSIVRTALGILTMFLRDRLAVAVYSSTSEDEGLTWSTPTKTILANNNAGIEAFQLASGATLLLFNNETGSGVRTPLTAALSLDGGRAWPFSRNLQVHDDNSTSATEFSYPTVLQTGDGYIHAAYTYDRQCIKYRRFTEEWIKSAPRISQ